MSKPGGPTKRLYLINRDFQLRYVRLALLVGLCSTLLTVCLIIFPLVQFRIIRFPNFLPEPFLWAIGLAAVVNFLIVAFLGVLVTHRIAGPMFSMTRHMHVMETTGRLDFVRIRATDDLKYLVRCFNAFVEVLRRQTEGDAAQLERLHALLQDSAAPGPDAAKIKEAAELSEQLVSALRRRL